MYIFQKNKIGSVFIVDQGTSPNNLTVTWKQIDSALVEFGFNSVSKGLFWIS